MITYGSYPENIPIPHTEWTPIGCLEILAVHGYKSIDDAREANVAFGCFVCGSIASVTPTEDSTREMQRDLIDWSCCDPGDDFRI